MMLLFVKKDMVPKPVGVSAPKICTAKAHRKNYGKPCRIYRHGSVPYRGQNAENSGIFAENFFLRPCQNQHNHSFCTQNGLNFVCENGIGTCRWNDLPRQDKMSMTSEARQFVRRLAFSAGRIPAATAPTTRGVPPNHPSEK